MKKTAFVLVLLALPAVVFAGNATLALRQMTTDATSVTLPATGGQVIVNVWLNTTAADAPEGVANVVANLTSYKADGVTPVSSVFSAVTRTAPHSTGYGPFDSSDSWDTALGTSIAGVLSPNSLSIGVAATGGKGTVTSKKNYAVPTAAYGIEDPETGDVTNYSFTTPWKIMRVTLNVAGGDADYILGFNSGSYVGTTTGDGVYPAALSTTLTGMAIRVGAGDPVVPEPASMLLLAAAVPFLRRRSA